MTRPQTFLQSGDKATVKKFYAAVMGHMVIAEFGQSQIATQSLVLCIITGVTTPYLFTYNCINNATLIMCFLVDGSLVFLLSA